MQNLVVFFVAVVGLAMAQSQINLEFEFFNRFGSIKAKQACFGMDAATEQFRLVDAAVKTCFTKFREPQVSPSNGVETLYSLVRKRRSGGSGYRANLVRLFGYIDQLHELSRTVADRRSSAIRYPSNVVSDIAKDIQVEADYFRCVMTEMGITNSNNELDLASMTANVNRMDVAAPLKKDLLHAVTECRKYALCVPDNKDAYPLPADVVTAQQYLFCERELRSLACIKNDARYIVDQFSLKGTDGRLDFLPSDSERVTALLFANSVVGPDDFGLYE